MVDADLEAQGPFSATTLLAALPPDLQARLAAAAQPIEVPGDSWLFHQGDPGDDLFIIRTGRVDIVREHPAPPVLLTVLTHGDSLGELALLEGGRRSAGARTARDCTFWRLGRKEFEQLLHLPGFASAMLAVLSRTVRGRNDGPGPRHDSVFALLDAGGCDAAGVRDALLAALRRIGSTALLREQDLGDTASLEAGTSQVLDAAERSHDFVVLDAGPIGGPWAKICARQADRDVILLGRDGVPPPSGRPDLDRADILCIGEEEPAIPTLDRWRAAVHPRAHHRLRPRTIDADVARTARRLTGRALGLCLSGGGARGFAHIGAIQALAGAGLEFDRFGGTSIGAFMSALAAAERTTEQIIAMARRQIVEGKPFSDWTVPRHGLIRGRRAFDMFHRVLGQTDVRQLPRSWFGISVALANAELVVHRDGSLAEAVGCSMSLPGIAPPRVHDGRLLIDGGVLNNLPVDVMLDDREGPVVAVDVAARFQVAKGRPQIPSIMETLGATMVLTSRSEMAARRAQALLVVEPEIADVGLLDWEAIDRAVKAGREAAQKALERTGPELDAWRARP